MNLDAVQAKSGEALAVELASLGYPGFAYLGSRGYKNPAEVLLSALSSSRLETRVVEALPWILLSYPQLDWSSVRRVAVNRNLQNKLGFVTNLARKVAESRRQYSTAEILRSQEELLSTSRLFVEDTLCNDALTQAEKHWLEKNRSDEAKYWRILSDLSPAHLSHV